MSDERADERRDGEEKGEIGAGCASCLVILLYCIPHLLITSQLVANTSDALFVHY